MLKNVNEWDANGVSVAPDAGQNKLKLFGSNGGSKVAEVTPDGKLLPEKYDFDPTTGKPSPNGTAVGEPSNGYQVYKSGDDVSVRRVPDKSAYSQSELNELTQHPNAHVLERHGHDVTDEALIKRANTGIAPDGNITNPPPYSSKFETTDQLKKALDNTRNGTPAFASKKQVGNTNRYTVEYTLTDGSTFGKGTPRNSTIFESMNKVFAVYEEVSPGDFKLITMFPNK